MRSAQLQEKKQAAQAAAQQQEALNADLDAQKVALAADADAFRGVHLAPNAHHWDEVSSLDEDASLTFLNNLTGRGRRQRFP